jgi:hypothetical protein
VESSAAAPLLAYFGVQLSEGPAIHDTFFSDHPAFPRLLPQGDHFLWFNVEELVLNHPTALHLDPTQTNTVEAPIRFAEPNQAFALEVFRGSGSVLFLSDASIFINDMQRYSYGDKQLVANLFRYYCEGSSCDVTVIPPWAREIGTYHPEGADSIAGIEHLFARAVEELNAQSVPTNESLSNRNGVYWLTLGLLFSLFAGAVSLFWLRGERPQRWVQPNLARPTHAEIWAKALAAAQQNADFTGPISALGYRFFGNLRELMGVDLNQADKDTQARFLRSIQEQCSEEVANKARTCILAFEKARKAAERAPHPMAVTSLQQFEQLWDDAQDVIFALHNQRQEQRGAAQAA